MFYTDSVRMERAWGLIVKVLDEQDDEGAGRAAPHAVTGQTTPQGSRGDGPEMQQSQFQLIDGCETDSSRHRDTL